MKTNYSAKAAVSSVSRGISSQPATPTQRPPQLVCATDITATGALAIPFITTPRHSSCVGISVPSRLVKIQLIGSGVNSGPLHSVCNGSVGTRLTAQAAQIERGPVGARQCVIGVVGVVQCWQITSPCRLLEIRSAFRVRGCASVRRPRDRAAWSLPALMLRERRSFGRRQIDLAKRPDAVSKESVLVHSRPAICISQCRACGGRQRSNRSNQRMNQP